MLNLHILAAKRCEIASKHEMDPAAIFIILIIISAVVVVVIFYIILRNRTQAALRALEQSQSGNAPGVSQPGNDQPSITGWSQATPVEGQRGLCSLYTYPPTPPNQPGSLSQPGILSMDTEVVDTLTPTSIGNVTCFDTDQLALEKVKLTCTSDGVFGNVCYDNRGREYSVGQNWEFYQQCNKTPCSDTLATIGLNFVPNDFTSKTACLEFDPSSTSTFITGERCDLTETGQLLRIERQNADGTANDSGPYGRLMDRITGLCVVPTSATPAQGTRLQLGNCAPADGYVWWFMPPRQATSTIIIDDVPVPVVTTAPQQLVYYPNQGKQPPANLAQLDRFIDDTNPLSMSVEVNTDGNSPSFGDTVYGQNITLQPLETNIATNPNRNQYGNKSNAQAIDYWLYRTISQTPVTCTDCGTNFVF